MCPYNSEWVEYDEWHEILYARRKKNMSLKVSYEESKLPKKDLFFIYGTLQSSNRNFNLLIVEKLKLLHPQILGLNFQLIEVANGVPGAVYSPGIYIFGELYEMQEENIHLMNCIEKPNYELQTVEVQNPSNGTKSYANIWVWNKPYDNSQLIGHNHWNANVEHLSYTKGLTPLCK